MYSGGSVLSRIRDITILPRGVSDHAPVSLQLELSCPPSEGLWRLSRFWLADTRVEMPCKDNMISFWSTWDRSTPAPFAWDAFNATMRGSFQDHIGRVRRGARKELQEAEAKVGALETVCIRECTPQAYSSFQEALRDVSLLRISTTKIHLLHQSQRIFEQGERSGRLLAWLSREHSSPVSIAQIQSINGEILMDPTHVNARFSSYQELYSLKVQYTYGELWGYLDQIDLPCLTDATRERLDSPLTLKEIQTVGKFLQNGKTPGPDGFSAEFYKPYADNLLPMYCEVLMSALDRNELPRSISEAVVVVLPKPGKNPELCSSYRPISLLNVDLKILSKVLAGCLNSVITALIHPDQTGFMPGRGTDINIRRLLTHLDREGGGWGQPGGGSVS